MPANPLTESSPSPPQEERAGERRPTPHRNSRQFAQFADRSSSGPCLDFVSSDDTLDRYQEIISPAGWQLASYQRNPVFQNSHQYGDILFTLGRALTTEVRTVNGRQALFQRIEFATEANPVARIAHALYAGKFLNTVSVGFIPLRWENGTADSGFTRKYIEQELLEVSAVAIPANPNALALAYKSGAVEKSDLKETADLLRQLIAAASAQRTPPPSPRPQTHPFLLRSPANSPTDSPSHITSHSSHLSHHPITP